MWLGLAGWVGVRLGFTIRRLLETPLAIGALLQRDGRLGFLLKLDGGNIEGAFGEQVAGSKIVQVLEEVVEIALAHGRGILGIVRGSHVNDGFVPSRAGIAQIQGPFARSTLGDEGDLGGRVVEAKLLQFGGQIGVGIAPGPHYLVDDLCNHGAVQAHAGILRTPGALAILVEDQVFFLGARPADFHRLDVVGPDRLDDIVEARQHGFLLFLGARAEKLRQQ